MIVLGLDGGSEQSALVGIKDGLPVQAVIESNDDILDRLIKASKNPKLQSAVLAIEDIESFGMAVGKTTFQTVFWNGRFAQAWWPRHFVMVPRSAIKLNLCHSRKATDSNIRQALIDRFGGTREKAIGKKKTPGPLYECTGHKLSALAVALTWADQHPDPALVVQRGHSTVIGEF